MSTLEYALGQPQQLENFSNEATTIIGGIFGQIKELLDNPVQENRLEKTSRQSLMRADLLAKRFINSQELYPTNQDKSALLKEDLKHIACETLLGQPITSWETIIDPQEKISLAGKYHEDIGVMSQSFTKMLTQEGKNQTRAEIETKNAHFMKQWALNNADTNNLLIWTSPPDDESQGYHGSTSKTNWRAQEKFHSFIYVMRAETQVVADENQQPKQVVVIKTDQLRAWPNINQLIEIQAQLLQQPNLDIQRLLPNDEKAVLLLIDNLIELAGTGDYETDLQSIIDVIYSSQAEWLFNPSQMPEVDQTAFWEQFNRLTDEFYLTEALPLFNQIQTKVESSIPEQFLISNEYQLILEQLDLLLDYWHMSLQKWVEDHDQNPQSQILMVKNLLQQLKKLPLLIKEELIPEEEKTNIIPINNISKMFKTDVKKRILEKILSPEEKRFYLANLNLLSLSGNFLSLAQCGVMTPFTLPFTIMRQGLSLGNFSQFSLAIQNLPIETQQRLLNQFNQYVPLQLQGAAEQFMVPQSYLGRCYLEGNQVMGPCGVPLSLDPDALPMSEGRFGQLINSFQSLISSQETNLLQNQLFDKAGSNKEREQVRLITTSLKKVFDRPITLDQLINNIIPITAKAVKILPFELLKEVRQSNAPFNQLIHRLVTKLMSDEYRDLLESVPEFNALLATVTDR